MIQITLPIYYTQQFKTKKDKTFLVGMNWYRNAHYFIQNEVKKSYNELVANAIKDNDSLVPNKYELHIKLYYKNPSCDGSNIASMMEKFVLDALQELNVVQNDNINFHVGTKWQVIAQDKENPRAEVVVVPV